MCISEIKIFGIKTGLFRVLQNAILFRNLLLQNARVAIDDACYSVGEGCSLMHIPTARSKVIEYGCTLAEKHSDKNQSDTYIAEISDKDSIELLRGLSRYNLIDEMVVYILPIIAGKGTPVFDDLTPSRWNIHKTTTFPNGITRIIYRNSCILQ